MNTIPYNSASWVIGSLSVLVFGLKSWRAYQESGNQIAKIYFWLSLAFSSGFMMYGLPAIFTSDTRVLFSTYIVSELCVQIGIQAQIWLLWFIGLRNHVRLRYLYALSVPYSLLILVLESLTSSLHINSSPAMIASVDQPLSLILKSILYFVVCWPLGYFFLAQAKLQLPGRARTTSIGTGLIFIIVSAGAIVGSVTSGGGDTVSSSVIDGSLFLGFMILNLIPKRIISFEHRTVATST